MKNAIDKVISIAMGEVGYLEKKTNSYLDEKTANAGSANYTKYARDLLKEIGSPYAQGAPWCDMFVDWCFVRAFGRERAREMLGGWSAYTPTSANYYRRRGRWHAAPRAGDQIFFKNSTRICHTGLVYAADSSKVYTIEGNTSGAGGVISNGGGVWKKSYPLNLSRIAGYGRPDYEETVSPPAGSGSATDSSPGPDSYPVNPNTLIRDGQIHANNFAGCGLLPDGKYGPLTRKAGIKVLQHAMNLDYGSTISEDGIWGPRSDSKLGTHYVRRGETQYMVTALEILLLLRGFQPDGVECPGCFGGGLERAVTQYQQSRGLPVTGWADAGIFRSLIT